MYKIHNVNIFLNFRLAHTALNQHRLAIECYKMALRLDVDNETYQNNLTLAEQQLREAVGIIALFV